MRHPAPIIIVMSAAAAALAACGGGGSPNVGVTTPTPPTLPPSPPSLPTVPSASSAEYLRSWGVSYIHASTAYNAGATGAGITVAVIDSGVDGAQADLSGALSADSTDIVAGRNQPVGTNTHATLVAGVIAARYNGSGSLGIAFGSTILSIRADNSVTGSFSDFNTAAAINYAVAHGARVINLSLGGDTPDASVLTTALINAANAGVVIVASAGNDAGPNPQWPARNNGAGLEGALIAAGALDQSGVIASYSNQAGDRASRYLTAPGSGLASSCDSSGCFIISGTSFAAPEIAGSLALLLQVFPNLTGRQAVDILFTSATDAGAAGADAVYGRGILNLQTAFAPLGTTSLPGAGGASYVLTSPPGTSLSMAFGDSLSGSGAFGTVIHDGYQRLFTVNLADNLPGGRMGLAGVAEPATRTDVTLAEAGPGVSLRLTSQTPIAPAPERGDAPNYLRGEDPSAAEVGLAVGRLSLTAWRGQGGVAAPAPGGGRDAYLSAAAPDRMVAGAYSFGNWSVSARTAWSRRPAPGRFQEQKGSTLSAADVAYRGGPWAARVSVGALIEPFGPLGSNVATTGPLAMPARTGFVTISAEAPLADGVSAFGEVSGGQTRIDGPLFSMERGYSSAWRVGVTGECRRLRVACSRLTFEISQPLRMESGVFRARLADRPEHYFDDLTFSWREASAAPSGREMDFGFFADRNLGGLGQLRLGVQAALQSGHRRDADPVYGLAANWRMTF